MDILNWLYMKTAGLIKTEANDAATDLVALGAEVPFTTRGDGYQTYSMTLADAVAAGCKENNTYRVGIYDQYPFIVTPSMKDACLTIIDTPAYPTFFPTNLESRKIYGVVDLSNVNNADSFYLGTVESSNATFPFAFFGPNKVTGQVSAYNDDWGMYKSSALADGVTVQDAVTGTPVDTSLMTIMYDEFAPGQFDMYLVWQANTSNKIIAVVSFEYELLFTEGSDVTFTIY
jgi:hypothetical protein